jgi:hypothetical protein
MLITRMLPWISNAPTYVVDAADFCGRKQVFKP